MNLLAQPQHFAVFTDISQKPLQSKHQAMCRSDSFSLKQGIYGKFTKMDT